MRENRPKRVYVFRSLVFFLGGGGITTGQMTVLEELTVAAWHWPPPQIGRQQAVLDMEAGNPVVCWPHTDVVVFDAFLFCFFGLVSGCLWERRCKSFTIFQVFGSACIYVDFFILLLRWRVFCSMTTEEVEIKPASRLHT